jgi:rhodanese-related sulfurtransferase
MKIARYLSSTLIGFSLGLLGAGGSILTVPVLVYLFRLEPTVAVRYSLFVVGATSLASSIPQLKKKILGALNIGLDGDFAPFVGSIIPAGQKQILLVCELGREIEGLVRLCRVGYHQCKGYLSGGMNSWIDADYLCGSVVNIDVKEMIEESAFRDVQPIDVRKPSEFMLGNVECAINIPLSAEILLLERVTTSIHNLVYCADGYRFMIFMSLLKANGFYALANVAGGYNATKAQKSLVSKSC